MRIENSSEAARKKKILLYLFGSLGDTLVAIPALRAVRRHFQNDELILLQNIPADGSIVSTSQVIPDGIVDGYLQYSVHAGALNKFLDFYKLWRLLRRSNFDAAVYLIISERSPRSVTRDRRFFRWCGISNLYGFHAFTKQELYPVDESGLPAMTERESLKKMRRLEIDGIESQPEDFRRPFLSFSNDEVNKVGEWLAVHRRKPAARLISIAPGCKTVANVWSNENFIEIGKRLLREGDYEIIVVGGKAEQTAAEELISAWGEGVNAAGLFSVVESSILLSRCEFHIGLDTGTTHLAAVAGVPCFALYGERNNPGQWFPEGAGHTIIYHPVACAGCRAHICPLAHHPCMKGISVDAVWKHLQEFACRLESSTDSETRLVAV